MATEEGRAAARKYVMREMSARTWKPADLAREAEVDYGTVGDFLNGRRWPKIPTLGKFDAALGWTPGTLAAIGEALQEAPTETVSAPGHTEGDLLFRRPEGISDPEWERIRGEALSWIEWQVERADRER